MGAVMKRAQKNGWIKPTGQYVMSERVQCHRRPVMVWEVT